MALGNSHIQKTFWNKEHLSCLEPARLLLNLYLLPAWLRPCVLNQWCVLLSGLSQEGTEHSDWRATSLFFLYIPVGIVDSVVFSQSQNLGQKCHKGFVETNKRYLLQIILFTDHVLWSLYEWRTTNQIQDDRVTIWHQGSLLFLPRLERSFKWQCDAA